MSVVVMDSAEVEALVRRVLRDELATLLAPRRTAALDLDGAPEFMSQTQAAMLVGRSVSTIRNWQRDGLLTRHGSGRVSRDELRAAIMGEAAPLAGGGQPAAKALAPRTPETWAQTVLAKGQVAKPSATPEPADTEARVTLLMARSRAKAEFKAKGIRPSVRELERRTAEIIIAQGGQS